MLDEKFKTAFSAAVKADGMLIERCISAFYSELSETWPASEIMVDGGACHGFHTKLMARLENVSRVIAIEASPISHEKLADAISRAQDLQKVELQFAALQADPNATSVEFQVSPSHPGRSGINPVMQGRDDTVYLPPVTVKATTIDKLCAGVENRIGFIKLDLEGNEYFALRGGERTLRASRPACVYENGFHTPKMNGYTREDLIAYFASVGLRAANGFGEVATPENLTAFWYAWAFPADTFEAHSERLQAILMRNLLAVPGA